MKRTPVLFIPLVLASVASVAFGQTSTPEAPKGLELISPSEEMLRLRDPFKRPDSVSLDATPRTELEKFPSDSFKMLAVLTGPAKVQVLLQDPDGKTHFVSENVVIGTRKGRVRKITPETVLIREKVVNILGQQENLDVVLRMPGDGPQPAPSPSPKQAGGGRGASARDDMDDDERGGRKR